MNTYSTLMQKLPTIDYATNNSLQMKNNFFEKYTGYTNHYQGQSFHPADDKHKINSRASLEVLCLVKIWQSMCCFVLFNIICPLCIYCGSRFYVSMQFLCLQNCVSPCLYVPYALSLTLFLPFVCFVLSRIACFGFVSLFICHFAF